MTTDVVPSGPKRRGRPPKSAVAAKKKPGKIGRPPGEAAIINDYKARLLASPKSQKVLDTILNAALDDDHKNQSAAWKLLVDRLMPLSYFDKDKASGGRNSISINITGVGGDTTIVGGSDDDIDGEYESVD